MVAEHVTCAHLFRLSEDAPTSTLRLGLASTKVVIIEPAWDLYLADIHSGLGGYHIRLIHSPQGNTINTEGACGNGRMHHKTCLHMHKQASPVTINRPELSCFRNTTLFPMCLLASRISTVPGVMLGRSLPGLGFLRDCNLRGTSSVG